MSYDISLVINTGKEDACVVDIGNYTSNIRPMYDKAFNVADWKLICDMTAKDAYPLIEAAYINMLTNHGDYMKLNPTNG